MCDVEQLKKHAEEGKTRLKKTISIIENAYVNLRAMEIIGLSTSAIKQAIEDCKEQLIIHGLMEQMADMQLSRFASVPTAAPTAHTSSPTPADETR